MYFQRIVASILGVCWFLLPSLIFRQVGKIIFFPVTLKCVGHWQPVRLVS